MNWRKWNAGKAERSERARRAAECRWKAARELRARAGEPVRRTRVVEFPIRDTHRPFALIHLEAEETEHGFGRWLVAENGQIVGKRRIGRRKIADMIARYLQ